MKSKEDLLMWYFKGYDDELTGRTSTQPNDDQFLKAYNIGAVHAEIDQELGQVIRDENEIIDAIEYDDNY